jgi:hypothetical protein
LSSKHAKHLSRKTVAVTFASFALSVFAILLWGRIKLVAGVPRTAYADPKPAQSPPPPMKPKAAPIPADRRDLLGD